MKSSKFSEKKIAVILSGCGHQDGAEITEAVATLVGLSENGASVTCFAPNVDLKTQNHIERKLDGSTRNVLIEAARIVRGNIHDLKTLSSSDFDGLVIPGGYGAALNLCSWAHEGAKCKVLPEVEKAILSFYSESKPIGAICIAPALIARVLGSKGVTVTIGEDRETAGEIQKTGAHHEICPVEDYVTDREHKVITTPAYMYADARPDQVFRGIQSLTKELVEMA